jgi:16S rRNA (cytosine967-C5)-methyltransferase
MHHDVLYMCPQVLLDAPCTGTGVLSKKPDLRWQREMHDLHELVQLQRALLLCAVRCVQRGGLLVYSTCSLEVEENQEQVEWLLQQVSPAAYFMVAVLSEDFATFRLDLVSQ